MTPEQYLHQLRETRYVRRAAWKREQVAREAQAQILKRAYAAGLTLRQLAEASGLSPEGVRGIINRETKEEGR